MSPGINLKGLHIENAVALGPMAGVTDKPFRSLCKEMGCGLLYTEMVSAKAVLYNNKNTHLLIDIDESERPVGMQLFGSDSGIMAEIAYRLQEKCDFIDINMGCPVPKIVNNNEGSALMKSPKLAEKIVSEMVKRVDIPVTVKLRAGFTHDDINVTEVAKAVESAGCAMVAVHGRTREQFYSGEADWNIIADVKKSIDIPVIGNGDIRDGKSAKKMLEITGCDGIMIGRAARGNPWIFREINHYLKTGEILERPDAGEIGDMIIRHGEETVKYKGEYTGIREMRKHIAWYVQGMRNAAAIRRRVNCITTMDELRELVMSELPNGENVENGGMS